MNNEQLQRVLKSFADSVEGGTEFVLTQAPEVLQQLILWKRIESVIFSIILLSLVAWLSRVCKRNVANSGKTESIYDTDWPIGIAAFTGGCAGLAFIVWCANLSSMLQVWFAPKVYILEYLRSFV
jgi:hypothetical protein